MNCLFSSLTPKVTKHLKKNVKKNFSTDVSNNNNQALQQQQQKKEIEQDVKTLMFELKRNAANEKLSKVAFNEDVSWNTFAKFRGIYEWLKVAEGRRTAV